MREGLKTKGGLYNLVKKDLEGESLNSRGGSARNEGGLISSKCGIFLTLLFTQ